MISWYPYGLNLHFGSLLSELGFSELRDCADLQQTDLLTIRSMVQIYG